jgi:hypothetical protein
MIANKNAITIRAIRKGDELRALLTDVEVCVGVGVSVEVGEDDGVEVELKGTFAGKVTVCILLQPLV